MALSAGSAKADVFQVQFWSYDGGGTFSAGTRAKETNPIVGQQFTSRFTYTGDLNWLISAPQGSPNIAGNFVLSAGGSISNYSASSLISECPTHNDFI